MAPSPQGSPRSADTHWLSLRRDRETGIETIRAHFTGHAYDLHDHEEVLVGYTESGVQRFRCRRSLQTSTPGHAILIEPGEVHDGHSPRDEGFTYAMLYLPQPWLQAQAEALTGSRLSGFGATLAEDPHLVCAIASACVALHENHGRLARDGALDRLVEHLSAGRREAAEDRRRAAPGPGLVRARDVLRDRFADDIGVVELARLSGLDRFQLSRQFRRSFGLSPHAWLVQTRLKEARRRLAQGEPPAAVAAEVGFSDQSHLGRWFRRAYRMTPAHYRALCTNVPDRA
jgi:AraC-like DNA-binding protein